MLPRPVLGATLDVPMCADQSTMLSVDEADSLRGASDFRGSRKQPLSFPNPSRTRTKRLLLGTTRRRRPPPDNLLYQHDLCDQ